MMYRVWSELHTWLVLDLQRNLWHHYCSDITSSVISPVGNTNNLVTIVAVRRGWLHQNIAGDRVKRVLQSTAVLPLWSQKYNWVPIMFFWERWEAVQTSSKPSPTKFLLLKLRSRKLYKAFVLSPQKSNCVARNQQIPFSNLSSSP